MTLQQKVALWDVVNDYMTACGGRERTTGIARQNAVVLVEGVLDRLLAAERERCALECAAIAAVTYDPYQSKSARYCAERIRMLK